MSALTLTPDEAEPMREVDTELMREVDTELMREKYFCRALEICYACWKVDPEEHIDLEDGRCPECFTDELTWTPREEDNRSAPAYSFVTAESEDEAEAKIEPECGGCKEHLLNQQGHMHKGGCLDDHTTT